MNRLQILAAGILAVTALASVPSFLARDAQAESPVARSFNNPALNDRAPAEAVVIDVTEPSARPSDETSARAGKLEGAQPSFVLDTTAASRHHGVATSGGAHSTAK